MNNKINIITRDDKDFLSITIEHLGSGLEFKIYKDIEMNKLYGSIGFVAEFTANNYTEINSKGFYFSAVYADYFYVNIIGNSYGTDLQIKTKDKNEILIYYFTVEGKFYTIIKKGDEYINYVDKYSTVKSARNVPN